MSRGRSRRRGPGRLLGRFLAGDSPTERGRTAEEGARAWLEGRGYRIVAANARTAGGEIDLVAVDGETLCFVEVKARRSTEFGSALLAVGRDKQRRLIRAATAWLAKNPWDGEVRFDVLALDGRQDGGRDGGRGGEGGGDGGGKRGERGERFVYTLVQDAFRVDP